MNRRTFTQRLVGAAMAASALPAPAQRLDPPTPEPPQPPFEFSVMLWTVFRQLPIEQRLERVSAAGYRHAELTGEFKHWSDQDFQTVLQTRRRLNLDFDATSGITRSLADPAQRPALLEELRSLLPTLERLEIPALIIVPGNVIPGMPRYLQHQSVLDGLRQAAEITAPRGIRLLVENIDPKENPRVYLTSVAEGLEMMRTLDHPHIKFLYDFYHEQIAEGDLIAKLQTGLDQIGLVHIADVPGRHEPGTGEINYRNIFKTLAELGYKHKVAMEYLPTSSDEIASLAAARRLAAAAAAEAAPPAG